MKKGIIQIKWRNGLGNTLFQYFFARLLSEKWKYDLTFDSNLDEDVPYSPIDLKLLKIGEHIETLPLNPDLPTINLDAKFREVPHDEIFKYIPIKANYLFSYLYLENYKIYKPFTKQIKSWFSSIETINFNDIIVHIRLGDFFSYKNRVIKPEKYINLLKTLEFDKVYIVTDDPSNYEYLNPFKYFNIEIISTFIKKTHELDDSKTILSDFNLIRSFNKIIFGNSTFGWMASFLSNASEIYVYKPWRPLKRKFLFKESYKISNLGETDYEHWHQYE